MTSKLTDKLNVDNIKFSKPIDCAIPGNSIKYKRVNIGYDNGDGKVSDLIIASPRVYSFGISESISPSDKKITGYTLPLCLWSNTGATEEEKSFVKVFEDVKNKCTQHVCNEDVYPQLGFDDGDIVRVFCKRIEPLFWKKDPITKKRVDGKGPVLYGKLLVKKKQQLVDGGEDTSIKILTSFYDKETNDQIMDPLKALKGVPCFAVAGVKFESLYVSSDKIVLQVKVYEVVIEQVGGKSRQRLLMSSPSESSTSSSSSNSYSAMAQSTTKAAVTESKHSNDEDHDDDGDVIPQKPATYHQQDEKNQTTVETETKKIVLKGKRK